MTTEEKTIARTSRAAEIISAELQEFGLDLGGLEHLVAKALRENGLLK